MTPPIELLVGESTRQVDKSDLPLRLGGADADIPLLGIGEAEPVAFIGLSDDQFFVQPNGSEPVVCNGAPVTTAQWLYDGDVVRIGANRIVISIALERIRFAAQHPSSDNVTVPPSTIVGRQTTTTPDEDRPRTVKPAEFKPAQAALEGPTRKRFHLLPWLAWAPLALLVLVAWLLFTSRSVEIVVEPEPDRLAFHGGLSRFGLSFGGRHLVRPGTYSLEAEKAGYEPLQIPVEVTRDSSQSYRFALVKLPGFLSIEIGGVEGVAVVVDGEQIGETPLSPLQLSPGEHDLRLVSRRYEEFETRITIEGGGVAQELNAQLVPRWAPVTIRSEPPGATIRADNEAVGVTPATVELLDGSYGLDLVLEGYKPHSRRIEVVANEPQVLPSVTLHLVDGRLVVRSDPEGAAVTIDGTYRGVTPLDLLLPPGREFDVELTKVGHEQQMRSVSVRSGRTRELTITLPAQLGEVSISATPAGAELYVDGQSRGEANQTLQLLAVPHRIEVRKDGYETFRTTITPRPGLAQAIEAPLKTAEEIRIESTPPLIRTSRGQELVLVHGGRFRMGASRREPGRRANETLHDVELVRPFYIGVKEISNGEFREFLTEHNSGRAGTVSLDYDHHPVVRVTWEDAVMYCNWLSIQESLPQAYEKRSGRYVAVRPPNTGYRLPTEAEWTFVARYPDGTTALKYPWGRSLPVPADAGNYGDLSAAGLLSGTIAGYDDHYPATAPVDSFEPNALGLLNLGGNVSEWVQDYYSVYPSRREEVDRDPLGPKAGTDHVVRGSSWMNSVVSELRLSYRDSGSEARPDLGFRLARYAD